MNRMLPSLWDEKNDPFRAMQNEMSRVFGDFARGLPTSADFATSFPAIDVRETDNGLEISAELPGVAEKDIDVSVSDRVLTIKGEKRTDKEIKEEDRYVTERSFGSFRRSMTLPFAPKTEGIEAHMDNGVLTIKLPKPAEAENQTHRIEVQTTH